MAERDKKRPRVVAVAGYDSFLRAAVNVAGHFEREGAQIDFVLLATRRNQITEGQLTAENIGYPLHRHTMDSLFDSEVLSNCDVVLLALEGTSSRKFFLRMEAFGANRPIVVAFYPGIVLRYPFDGLSSRSPADYLWLNSEDDLGSYRSMCKSFGVDPSNARLLGVPQLLTPLESLPSKKKIVFFEQAVIPRSKSDREYLAEKLVQFAQDWPDYQIVIKPRHRETEYTLHKTRAHIEPLVAQAVAGNMPGNLVVSYDSAKDLLKDAAACMTISSTVALEAIDAGIPVIVISDFGAHDDSGIAYFFGSGLLRQIDEVDLNDLPRCNVHWREHAITKPQQKIRSLVGEVMTCLAQNEAKGAITEERGSLYFSASRRAKLHRDYSIDEIAGRTYQIDRKIGLLPVLLFNMKVALRTLISKRRR